MASRSATLLVFLSALLVATVQLPAGRVVPQPRCSRHNFVVLKVPSKKKSGTAKGAKKPAGFAKRSAPPTPATALPKGSWETLRSWLKDRGAKVGGVVAEEVLPGLRGAVATASSAHTRKRRPRGDDGGGGARRPARRFGTRDDRRRALPREGTLEWTQVADVPGAEVLVERRGAIEHLFHGGHAGHLRRRLDALAQGAREEAIKERGLEKWSMPTRRCVRPRSRGPR